MFVWLSLLIAGAGLAGVQALSTSCTSALFGLAAGTTCLDLFRLAPLALSSRSGTVIPTVNSWLTGMCGQVPCSNPTLQAVVTSIINGCSSDLASVGLPTDPNTLTSIVQAGYPTFRQIACSEDTTSSNTLCVTELLNDLESSNGTISINYISDLITRVRSGASVTVPQDVMCSSCSKAAYTITSSNFPSLLSGERAVVQSECGPSFTNGQMPSNIH